MPNADRHGWQEFQGYLSAHDGWLSRYNDHFLIENTLKIEVIDPRTLLISGRLRCIGDLFIDVSKTLEMNSRQQVRTVKYSYHAGIVGAADRPIFRYDNYHAHPGHDDEHHRYHYDISTWKEIKPPEWVGHQGWPTLGEVIDELFEWWNEVGRFALNHDPGDIRDRSSLS